MQKIKYINNLHNKIDLFEIYKSNGATLNQNGQKIQFATGFQCSVKDLHKTKQTKQNKIIKQINNAIKHAKNGYNVGLWVENDFVYIDYSVNITDKKTAMQTGKKYNQKSVYDWQNQKCVYISYGGKK